MFSKKAFSIAITGEWPGAGQTTTAKAIAIKLNLTRIYAGFLFRKFAFVWNIQKDHQTWQEFESSIANNTFDLESVPFQEKYFNQQTLKNWQNQLKKVDNMDMWDKIIDQQSYKALLNPGTIVEGKVAVLLDKIDLGFKHKINHKVIKILLTCDPETAAQRILQRKIQNGEQKPITPNSTQYKSLVKKTKNELISIHHKDWDRYSKIYHVKRKTIFSPDIHQIDTSDKNQEQVLQTAINLIKKLTQ